MLELCNWTNVLLCWAKFYFTLVAFYSHIYSCREYVLTYIFLQFSVFDDLFFDNYLGIFATVNDNYNYLY